MRYDIAIIGSGPAGLSAAVNAKIRNKSFIIFGNKSLSTKIEKAPSIDNYLGLYNISGANLKQHFMDHIESMDIQIDEHKITNVYSMGDYFALASGSEMFEATTVIIAIGLDSAKSIEGEDTFLGRGVSYCATCDAPLYKGKDVPMRNNIKQDLSLIDSGVEILDKKPTEIQGEMLVNKLNFQDESLDIDGVFIIKDSMSPKNLVPGLELNGEHIKVDANMKTNIDGLFACGDCVGRPYSYLKSAGQGLTAALNAVEYIAKKSK